MKRPTERAVDGGATSTYPSAPERVLGRSAGFQTTPTITRAYSSRRYSVLVRKESGADVEFGKYETEPEARTVSNFLNSLGCKTCVIVSG